MKIKSSLATALVLLAGGCATGPDLVEARREVVLEYIGHDVGTVGPFSKQATRELATLSAGDRSKVLALMEHGAAGFLIIERDPARPNRIVLLAKGKIVGDFPSARDESGR